ncbi:hypothetical protein LTR85_008950 [Meristemomyces frigidus]|nr:hypothetical protein LTR85_008950 [Meristemomyces frigidus]
MAAAQPRRSSRIKAIVKSSPVKKTAEPAVKAKKGAVGRGRPKGVTNGVKAMSETAETVGETVGNVVESVKKNMPNLQPKNSSKVSKRQPQVPISV